MSTLYHAAKADGTSYGQTEAADIISKLRSGEWGQDVLIWKEGWEDWQPATVLLEPDLPLRKWGVISATRSVFGYRLFDFRGRSGRAEYWYSVPGMLLGLFFIGVFLGTILDETCALIALAGVFVYVSIARIALNVRRLHDIGMSGWWYLLSLLPMGDLFLLVIALLPSGIPNQWGNSPQRPLS